MKKEVIEMSHFLIPKHVYIGKDALQESEQSINECGSRALIVTGKHVGKSPMMGKLKDTLVKLGIEYVIFDNIPGEPTDLMIKEGLQVYKESGCDFLIGIGGGSPLDSAKAIAAMSVNPGKIADYMGKEIGGNIPPIVAIPTTSGTGSEATRFTVITDSATEVKMLLKGDKLIPAVAVVALEFTMDMPRSVTASTGLDALTHAIEAYTSKKAFPLTDSYAVSAVKRIMKYLPIAYKRGSDPQAREQMAIAAFEAGVCINNSSVTLVHGLSRPIGANFHVPHGISNAMLLSECLKFAIDGAYDKFSNLGKEIGIMSASDSRETLANKFVDAVAELAKTCEVPTLKEFGIEPEAFEAVTEKMAEDAIKSGSPANTVKNVSKEDCILIYKKAYGI